MRSLAHAGREDPAVPITVNPIIPDPTETTNPIIPAPIETTNPIIPAPTETTNPIGPTDQGPAQGPAQGPDQGPDPTATADPALASLLDQLTKDAIIFDTRSSGRGRNARQSLEESDGSDEGQFHILPIPFDPNSDVVPDPTVTVAPDASGIFIPKDPNTTFVLDPSVTISSPEPDATFSPDPSVTVAPDLTTTRLPFFPTKNVIVRAL